MEHRMLCKQCRHVFNTAADWDASQGSMTCPACGSSEVAETPAWAPMGSGWNILEDDMWEYKCQECGHTFKMPIPKSPTEDKARRCPACNGNHLHLLTNTGGIPLHCG